MQLFDSAFIETAPSLETIRVWGYPLIDTLVQKITYVRPSHADFSSTMPRNSIESQRSAAKSTKSDGDGSFYKLELGGGVENAPTTPSPIGDPSLPTPEGPCDGGTQAFLFFGSAFMIEALLWGMFSPSFFNSPFTIKPSCPTSAIFPAKSSPVASRSEINSLWPYLSLTSYYCFSKLTCAIGMPATFGTFNAFYKKHPNFRDSPFIPVIGALCTVSNPLR